MSPFKRRLKMLRDSCLSTELRHHLTRLLLEHEEEPPIPMRLYCPSCGIQHIDAPNPETGWTNPPHRSHLCQVCGAQWRPADVPTTGVETLQTEGKQDSWPTNPEVVALPARPPKRVHVTRGGLVVEVADVRAGRVIGWVSLGGINDIPFACSETDALGRKRS